MYVGTDIAAFDIEVRDNLDKVEKPDDEFWVIYTGSIGHSYAIDNVVRAASQMKDNERIKFSVQNEWKLHLYGYNRSIIDGLVKTSTIESNTEVYKKYARALRRDIAIPLKYERRLKARIVWILYFISPCITSKLMLERGKNRMVKSGD